MVLLRLLCSFLVMFCMVAAMQGWPGDTPAPSKIEYNRDIRPILAKNCFSCHGSDEGKRSAGLRLDQRDSAIAPGKKRPAAIVPGKEDESTLIARITTEDASERMPPEETGNHLTPSQIQLLKQWVKEGANYQQHWAFVKPAVPSLPAIKQTAWPKQPLDHFILARLEQEGLSPSPQADRYALLRRLSLDLRGLPPSMEEIKAWEKNTSAQAYEQLVDQLLADQAYGERWARVWLDLARYADSAGYGSDPLRPNMWRYRDWVIDAFNKNMPYDQFTMEQLAGDLLPGATMEQRMATAFHRNTMTNTEGGTDDEEFRVAAVKDRINTTMQVWMGLTMGCASCHSHKYDPISHAEYYQAYAIFNQTADNDQPNEVPTMPAPTEEQKQRTMQLDKRIAGIQQWMELPSLNLVYQQAVWEHRLRGNTTWVPFKPSMVTIDKIAQVKEQTDATIQVQPHFKNMTNATITVTGNRTPGVVTGLRLETVPGIIRVGQGAGLNKDGDFVLSRVTAHVRRKDDKPPVARFVRIQLPGRDRILSLAEVQVFSGRQNIALGGDVSQSSTDFLGDAARAVDGNTDGDFFKSNSVTHTRQESDPWWEVKLSAESSIDRIVIWNRTLGVENRLQGVMVQLLDMNHQVIWEQKLPEVPLPVAEIETTGKRLEFAQAVADYSQPEFDVENLIRNKDLTRKGWAVGPRIAEPHQAQLIFKEPVKLEADDELVIQLEHRFQHPYMVLGSFRLSTTNDPRLGQRAIVPAKILALIDKTGERNEIDMHSLSSYYRSIAPSLKPWRDEIARLEKSKPTISQLPVMEELPEKMRRATHIMHKGNFLAPGDAVQPGLPALFKAEVSSAKPVNRLDLARWLVHSDNPLTARVAVNRIWAQLFGTGLVESEEDFGTQGELPSHPALLDYLATHFQHDLKWNTKALIKSIVMSASYQQSSKVTPELLQKDPRNRLISRGPRYRLEAEMVRDQALALSGLLYPKIGGPSVFPRQPDGLWQAAFNGERTWTTSRGQDRYRRGLYTFWRRTIPYPSMAAFDAPSRELCQVKRVRSNTPVQAFVTLNDPVYVEAAQGLARRIVKEGGSSLDDRLKFALKLTLARPAEEAQLAPLRSLFERERARYLQQKDAAVKLATEPLGPPVGNTSPEQMAELAAWTVVANVLLNLDGVLMK